MKKINILVILLLLFTTIGLAAIIVVTATHNRATEKTNLQRLDSLKNEIHDRDTVITECLKYSAYLKGMHQNCNKK